MNTAQQAKKEHRQQAQIRLKAFSAENRQENSKKATRLLLEQEHWQKAKSVLLYVPLGDELDLLACLEEAQRSQKLAALPRYLPDQGLYCAAIVHNGVTDLSPGQFGIPEPHPNAPVIPLNRLDLALVPGLAFDLAGRRLGRGRGFYDRLLAEVAGVKCGVAFDDQIVPELPVESHDIGMNHILTPTRWVTIHPGGT